MFRKLLFWCVGGAAIVVGSFFGTLWAADRWWPLGQCEGSAAIELKRPFNNIQGFAYFATAKSLGSLANNSLNPNRSPLRVCEDGRLMGPPHLNISEIASMGAGRFTHWDDGIYFSSFDNSDPNTNGRRYSAAP